MASTRIQIQPEMSIGGGPFKKTLTLRSRTYSNYITDDSNSPSCSPVKKQSSAPLEKKRVLKLHKPSNYEEQITQKKSAFVESFSTISDLFLSFLMMVQVNFSNLVAVILQMILFKKKFKCEQEEDDKCRPQKASSQDCLQSKEAGQQNKRLTLVLDLDETLIHSTLKKCGKNADLIQIPGLGADEQLYLHRRPYLTEFLRDMSRIFNLVVFTASQPEYADPILDFIDKDGLIQQRLYRDSCSKCAGGYIKCLDLINEDLSRVILLDNSAISGAFNKENLLLIKPWYTDADDIELLRIGAKLKTLENESRDLRLMINRLMSAE